ncbi:MAG: hypothetical protein ACXWTY_16840 [Methylobacter sp.]
MADRNATIQYYSMLIQIYDQAHNHKEISAWSGAVLEVVFCGMILQTNTPVNPGLIAAICFATLLIFLYVQNQLKLKDYNGAISSAAIAILAEIACADGNNLSTYLAARPGIDPSSQASHCLPDVLLSRAEYINVWGYSRKITRCMIYGTLMVSGLVTIFLISLRAS